MRTFKNFTRCFNAKDYTEHIGNQLVEPNQCMTPEQMLNAWVTGKDLPPTLSNSYDESPNIDDIGYNCGNTLQGMDYLKSLNEQLMRQKKTITSPETQTVTELVESGDTNKEE